MMKTPEQILDKNHKWITDDSYQEIIKLDKMLKEADIPHTFHKFLDGYQLCYPADMITGHCVCDAIENFGSYGCEQDLLEIQGLITKEENSDVLGWLTAQNVFERIKKHYCEVTK